MTDDKYDILGPLYGDMGGELAEIVRGDPDGAYLYAEAGDGWVSASVFKEDGKVVRYFRPNLALCDLTWKTGGLRSPTNAGR